MKIRKRGEQIRNFIIQSVAQHPRDLAAVVSKKFQISRQASNRHIMLLVQEGCLTEQGQTKNRVYRLAANTVKNWSYQIVPGLAEDVVWREDLRPAIGDASQNVIQIWNYGFTEMFNNAMDHSGGTTITVRMDRNPATTTVTIADNGVGIFRKIQSEMGLLDERHAVLELAKGKLTTDPARHTGQGIFFSSRMFDRFFIISGGVSFSHNFEGPEDYIFEQENTEGTVVIMRLQNHTARTMKRIFDQFSSTDGDYAFTKTVVPVTLARYKDELMVSRSQAKRLLARVELFKIVIFDFKGVPSVGQAFADEIFRVFPKDHPQVTLMDMNANSDVARTISAARAGDEAQGGSAPTELAQSPPEP